MILVVLESGSAKMLTDAFVGLANNGEYAIRVVRSGRDAVSAVQTNSFDVILLDDAIIEMEGERVLLDILRLRSCPIILMTPYISSALVPRFMEMGGYGCIRKSFEINCMNEVVSRAIYQSH